METHEPRWAGTHESVMVSEVTEIMASIPSGVFLDATVGSGGHAAALLKKRGDLSLVGLDQDPTAISSARGRLGGDSVLRQGRFDSLEGVLTELGIESIVGALFDLGVSSMQIDDPDRGFSYTRSGPIDMRMNPANTLNAAEIVNHWPQGRIAALLQRYGDERFAMRIARAIVAARPLNDTLELAEVISSAVPDASRRRGGHPAKRSFQALRIAVNEELQVLEPALRQAIDRLEPLGRGAVLSYHSGEDRIVKNTLRSAARGDCSCPPRLPCRCGATPRVRLHRRGPLRPGFEETSRNPRSASARLRFFEKL